MLDASQVLATAQQALEAARVFFKIDPTWEIRLELEGLDDGTYGECETLPQYRRATIKLDPAQIPDLKEVWETTGHEAAHVMLNPFNVTRCLIVADENWSGPIDFAWTFGCEQVTMTLQHMFTTHCPYPVKVARGRVKT